MAETEQQNNPFIEFLDRYRHDWVALCEEVVGVDLDPQQHQVIQWVQSGERKISVRSGHGVGKIQCNQIFIPTPQGTRLWGDLEPGDQVFGSDGAPTTIQAKFPHSDWPFYRITFDDGSSTLCGLEHLWTVRGRQERRKKLDTWRTLSLEEILEIGVKRKNGASLARQWEIPVQGPAQFEEREIDVHPYLMGVWLGDGTKGEPAYTKPHPEVTERVQAAGYEVSAQGNNRRVLGISHLLTDAVFSKGSHERYIPEDYLHNTVDNRMELLRGLCDTDGEAVSSGTIEYSTTSKQLADDVIYLARSLGCKAKLRPTVRRGRYRNADTGEMIECRDCYRVGINAPFNPFSIPHKRDRYKPSEHRYTTRWIESVEFSHYGEGHCIQVAAEDGLYQANDFIVTHNTTVTALAIICHMLTRYPQKTVVTAPTSSQLYDALFAEVKGWIGKLPRLLRVLFEIKSDRIELKASPSESFVSLRTSRAEQPEALQGVHARNVLLIADEASGVPEGVFDAAAGSMSGENATTLLLGNPTKGSGFFYDTHHKLRAEWRTLRISCVDSPRVSDAYVREMASRYGEESNVYRVRVLGEFPTADDDTLIPLALTQAARHRDVEESPVAPMVWGVDVARFGDDKSSLVKRKGNVVPEPPRRWKGLDTMQLTGAIKAEWDATQVNLRPAEIIVDVIGIGAGVVDRLREMELPVRGLNVSESPSLGGNALNLRMELWQQAKEWLAARDSKLPEDDQLEADLVTPRYWFTSSGKTQLESKEQMKKRGLPSPDDGDAFVLTFGSTATRANGYRNAFKKGPLKRNLAMV